MTNFNLKSFIIGVIIGTVVACSILLNYVDNNYIKIYDVDIGHFCFKGGHIFQLEQLVDESKLNADFKPVK